MINNVVLTGRLTRDPELRKTGSGMSVASFTLATDDSRKGPNGERVTIFMPITVWGNTADTVSTYMKKGNLVGITGRLTQRKYVNKAGVEVTATEITATTVEFMEPKSATGAESGYTPDAPVSQPVNQATTGNTGTLDLGTEDDLPW